MKNINKKKLFGSFAIGSLVITAPIAAFAYMDDSNSEKGSFEDKHFERASSPEFSAENLDMVKEAIDRQSQRANFLLEKISDDQNADVLRSVVADYAELEEFLASVDVDNATADELRDVFFEIRLESSELNAQIREVIRNSFSIEERIALSEEMQADGLGFDMGKGKRGFNSRGMMMKHH